MKFNLVARYIDVVEEHYTVEADSLEMAQDMVLSGEVDPTDSETVDSEFSTFIEPYGD